MASGKATSDVANGPVLNHINKRIRNLRKKLKRIAQIEDSIAQGKSIIKNKEQEELLKSKPTIIAVVDELVKSRQPLSVAVNEEITLVLRRRHTDNDGDCKKAPKGISIIKKNEQEKLLESKPTIIAGEQGKSRKPLSVLAMEEEFTFKVRRTTDEVITKPKIAVDEEQEHQETEPPALPVAMDDLLSLIYFGIMFDTKPVDLKWAWHERSLVVAHDAFHQHIGVVLTEVELDAISMLSSLMISRPSDCRFISHQHKIQRCIEHANHWICMSNKQIDPSSEFTYADVREMLKKVMGLGYFKNTQNPTTGRYQIVPTHLIGTFTQNLPPYEQKEGEVKVKGDSSDDRDYRSDDDYYGYMSGLDSD